MAEDAKDPLSRYLEAAMGLTELTRQRAEAIVKRILEQGDLASNPRELVEDLLQRSQDNREAIAELVRSETERAMKRMGLATQGDVRELREQLEAVRRQLGEAEDRAADAEAGEEAVGRSEAEERAKRTAAERTGEEPAEAPAAQPAKEAAKRTAKRATAEKATKKKTTGKKATAKRAGSEEATGTSAREAAKRTARETTGGGDEDTA